MCFAEPCPQDGCANVSCPVGLVRHSCAPCPLTCAHISGATTCDLNSECFSGELFTVITCCRCLSFYCTIVLLYSVSSYFLCCFLSGCWCPDGTVMNHEQQCVLPEKCVCEVSGVLYWPGQQVKVGCDICVCERGRVQHCQPNPECSGEHTHSLSLSYTHTFHNYLMQLIVSQNPLMQNIYLKYPLRC